MRVAQVQTESGFVVGVVLVDNPDDWDVPEGYSLIVDAESTASPGFTYDGSAFVPPPPLTMKELGG